MAAPSKKTKNTSTSLFFPPFVALLTMTDSLRDYGQSTPPFNLFRQGQTMASVAAGPANWPWNAVTPPGAKRGERGFNCLCSRKRDLRSAAAVVPDYRVLLLFLHKNSAARACSVISASRGALKAPTRAIRCPLLIPPGLSQPTPAGGWLTQPHPLPAIGWMPLRKLRKARPSKIGSPGPQSLFRLRPRQELGE